MKIKGIHELVLYKHLEPWIEINSDELSYIDYSKRKVQYLLRRFNIKEAYEFIEDINKHISNYKKDKKDGEN